MKFQVNCENAIANRGNLYRLKQFLERAKRGEKLNIGFIGGSITMGCAATTPQKAYAWLIYEWFQKKFPQSEFSYINAGIGATTSQFATARAESDLLSYKPDLIFVEFSVNDESNELFLETFEGLIRILYTFDQKTGILVLNSVRYQDGGNAEIQHGEIARYYDLPQISMQSSIYPEVVRGRFRSSDITVDDLHPNDVGHEMVAEIVNYFLEKVLQNLDVIKDEPVLMKKPLTDNHYEHACRYQNCNATPQITGAWMKDTSEQKSITEVFKNGWYASEKGASITFETEGTEIAIQYRMSVKQPAPIAEAVVDGKYKVELNANFEETWGDCLYIDTVLRHADYAKHTVTITLTDHCEDAVVPFYLASVISSY